MRKKFIYLTIAFWIKRVLDFWHLFFFRIISRKSEHILECNIHISYFNFGMFLWGYFQLINHYFILDLFFFLFIENLAINNSTIR
jgi:hypothetical protein